MRGSFHPVRDGVRVPHRLVIALTLSSAVHFALVLEVGVRSPHRETQEANVIEVRLVAAGGVVGNPAEPALEIAAPVLIESGNETAAQASDAEATASQRQNPPPLASALAMGREEAASAPPPLEDGLLFVEPDSAVSPTYYSDSEVDAMPVALDPILPRYPPGSAAASVGGKVTLRLLIDEAGVVKEAIVVEAVPPEVFEESARDALKIIRFKPAEKDGKLVASQTVMTITYAGSAMSAAAR